MGDLSGVVGSVDPRHGATVLWVYTRGPPLRFGVRRRPGPARARAAVLAATWPGELAVVAAPPLRILPRLCGQDGAMAGRARTPHIIYITGHARAPRARARVSVCDIYQDGALAGRSREERAGGGGGGGGGEADAEGGGWGRGLEGGKEDERKEGGREGGRGGTGREGGREGGREKKKKARTLAHALACARTHTRIAWRETYSHTHTAGT